MDAEKLRAEAVRSGQGHLFTFWAELDTHQQSQLLADVTQIDFELVDRLIPTHVKTAPRTDLAGTPEPADALSVAANPAQIDHHEAVEVLGQELIAEGKVAALIVAGGQGTRLGFDRPKGEFPISPVMNKPLFQLFDEAILATGKRYGRPIPWYVMTGPTTHGPTREYFTERAFFGLDADDVFFFCQGVMPAVNRDGRILLDRKHRVSLSPDGHGGCLRALATTSALEDMRRRGVEVVSYFQVDNPLISPVDPLFVGLHRRADAEMSAIAVPKAGDLERVGNFARIDGRLHVIEYSDLPDDFAHARNPNGSRRFDDGNAAVHTFSREFLERLTSAEGSIALPWHRAEKKVDHVDVTSGERIVPDRPNAVKLELFVFDALPLADRTMVLRRDRAECFSPVKNAEGADSPATARRDLSCRAARWLEACGLKVPRTPDGEPDGTFEVSPLLALDAHQLRSALTELPTVKPGARVYLD